MRHELVLFIMDKTADRVTCLLAKCVQVFEHCSKCNKIRCIMLAKRIKHRVRALAGPIQRLCQDLDTPRIIGKVLDSIPTAANRFPNRLQSAT